MKKIAFIAVLLTASALCAAKVELPAVIGSNMVIQQQADAPIWGKAAPRATVTVTTGWNSEKVTAKADKDGRWSLTVKTPAASLTSYSISISDGEEVVLDNVLVGDVWFCSGQSNMDMRMTGNNGQPVEGSADAILGAKPSRPIRIFKVGRATSAQKCAEAKGAWRKTTPDVVSNSSAVAYFFADYIQNILEIPIGIVQSSWGGSTVEAWMSEETINKSFAGKFDMSHITKGADLGKRKAHQVPCMLYNGMVAPLEPMKIKGILWYQGCSNRKDYADYAQRQAALVQQIRKGFGSPDAPFYFVQIAPYAYGAPDDCLSAYLQEAQEKSLDLIPGSGMATTVDIGEKSLIHPAKKKEVGVRLAWLALLKTYGISKLEATAPRVKDIAFNGGKAEITFTAQKLGLVPRSGNIPNFELAGSDKVFHGASARYDSKKGIVVVSSGEVPSPVAVRYCWKNWCVGELKNTFGVPVGPFRSDDWPYEPRK